MNTIKVKDYDSMQNITVGLAKNGYFVTTENVSDENYKSHWEIKYCESSEIKEKQIVKDHDYSYSMEIHNNDNTKGVKCKIISDEKPLVENEKEVINSNPYGLIPRDNTPDIQSIPQQDVSDNITDDQIEVITNFSIWKLNKDK